jgi:LacI family transcriptional regulator
VKGRTSVTIAEVARLAGVSTATAGRALGDYGYASEATRERVLKAARKLDYRPNLLARGLITGRTRTIGVVAGDLQSPFYAAILRGISDVVGRQGFGLLITNSDEKVPEEVRAVELLREKQVDGLIVSPCDTVAAGHLRDAVADLPLVLIDREVAGLEVDSVGVDSVASSRDCIARLIGTGHRRIGIIAELESSVWGDVETILARAKSDPTSQKGLFPSWQRLLGYVLAHRDAGLPVDPDLIRRVGEYSAAAAERQTHDLLAQPDRPSALFTADGLMSTGAMAAISARGLRIPDDLSLVGFDDLDWMAFVRPGISAVAQPRRAMGEAAARMLLERIEGLETPHRRLLLATQRIDRDSVAPPATAPQSA